MGPQLNLILILEGIVIKTSLFWSNKSACLFSACVYVMVWCLTQQKPQNVIRIPVIAI
jgi:hypothetical protein